jgi:hypothetical protein
MANQKIHEYLLERFSIGDDDFFDIDYFDGAVYTTAKVKGSVIKAIAGASENIYNVDGTLTADRTLDGDGNTLTFDNLRQLFFNLNPAPIGVTGVEFNVQPNGDLFVIRDAGTGDERFRVTQTGNIQFNGSYLFPLFDGTAGQVLTTDGVGNLTFQNQQIGTNIYDSNGTLTGDRILTGSNFELLFQTLGQFIVESHQNGVDGNIIFEVRSDAVNHSFIIRDHNTGVHTLACKNGAVEISDNYFLPTNAGTNGQVLTSNGAGNTSWQTPAAIPTIYNQVIENQGVPLTQRNTINFQGAGVSVTDIPFTGKTLVTIPGAVAASSKFIGDYYEAQMSNAAGYTWNAIAPVQAPTVGVLFERWRFKTFPGTGGPTGVFVNAQLPNDYVTNTNIRVRIAVTTNGTGGNVKFFVGMGRQNQAFTPKRYGQAAQDTWGFQLFAATANYENTVLTVDFTLTQLLANEPISVMVMRSPADAQDTFTGDAFLNSIHVETI